MDNYRICCGMMAGYDQGTVVTGSYLSARGHDIQKNLDLGFIEPTTDAAVDIPIDGEKTSIDPSRELQIELDRLNGENKTLAESNAVLKAATEEARRELDSVSKELAKKTAENDRLNKLLSKPK